MNRVLAAALAILAGCALAAAALAQGTIMQLPNVSSGGTYPLPDSNTTPQGLWMEQGTGDFRITPEQLGYIHQGTTAPATPFLNQLWWDTSQTPALLRSWNGSSWGPPVSSTVDIRQFGAKDDGTNTRVPFETAVNAMAGKGCIFIPNPAVGFGIDVTSGPVILPSGTCLQGTGGGSRIFALAGSDALFQTASGGILRMNDIALDGNRAGGANVTCLQTDAAVGSQGMELDRVTFRGCGGSALILDGAAVPSANIQVHNSFMLNNGAGISARYLTAFNFDNNLMQQNDGWGIACAWPRGYYNGYCQYGTIVGNVLKDNGVMFRAGNIQSVAPNNHDVTIANNTSSGGSAQGIHFGGQRITYISNHIAGAANEGIETTMAAIYATGTASVANGSKTVTGLGTAWLNACPDIQKGFTSDDGTRFQTDTGDGAVVHGGGNAPGMQIKSIDSNNSLTLVDAWSTATLTNVNFGIWCPISNIDNVLIGNTVEGVPSGYAAIRADRPVGGAIVGNVSDDPSGSYGILVVGATPAATDQITGITVASNTMSGKSGSGIGIVASSTYSTGTVTAANGNATVTLSGGSFDNIPSVTRVNIDGDPVSYAVTAQTSTTLTLGTPYGGTGGAGLSYIAQSGMSIGVNLTGNLTNHNNYGIYLQGATNSPISGGVYGDGPGNGGTAAIVDANTSADNLIVGVRADTIQIRNEGTQWIAGTSLDGLVVGNVPATPGGKKTLCIDDTTGKVYKTSGGSC